VYTRSMLDGVKLSIGLHGDGTNMHTKFHPLPMLNICMRALGTKFFTTMKIPNFGACIHMFLCLIEINLGKFMQDT